MNFQIKRPVIVWDPVISFVDKVYVLIHFPLVVLFYHELTVRCNILNQTTVTMGIIVLLFSITSVGFILERRWFAYLMEFTRCLAFFAVECYIWPVVESIDSFELHRILLIKLLRVLYLSSIVYCGIGCLMQLSQYIASHKRIQLSSSSHECKKVM